MDTATDLAPDRIERSIEIDADAERVWSLVSRPGWWINENEVDPDPVLRPEADCTVVVHEKFGEFRIRTLEQRPPRFIAYRWLFPDEETGTLIEFWIEDRTHGVILKVVESGLSALDKPHADLLAHIAENTSGWESELAAAARFVLSGTAYRR